MAPPKKKEAKKQIVEEKKEEEPPKITTMWDIPIVEHIYTEQSVSTFLGSNNIRDTLINYLIKYYDQNDLSNKYDYNELLMIVDFQIFNIVFAKEDLKLNNEQIALLLNIFSKLIEFSNFKDFSNESFLVQQELKMSELKKIIESFSIQDPPNKILVFTIDQVEKIMNYVNNIYIKNFKLYYTTFNYKQKVVTKPIRFTIDPPPILLSSANAKFIGVDRIIEEVKKEAEEIEKIPEKESGQEKMEEKKIEEVKKEGILDEVYSKLDNLNLDSDTYKYVSGKLQVMQKEVEVKLKSREEEIKKKYDEYKVEVKKGGKK